MLTDPAALTNILLTLLAAIGGGLWWEVREIRRRLHATEGAMRTLDGILKAKGYGGLFDGPSSPGMA